MPTFVTLALATPIFGFALTPPVVATPSLIGVAAPVFAQVDDAAPDPEADVEAAAEVESDPEMEPDPELEVQPEPASATEPEAPRESAPTPAEIAEASAAPSEPSSGDDYASQLRLRSEILPIHRAFGIATWVSMLATEVLGTIQYVNLYGFFGGVEDTPCVQGGAVFGQDQCWGTPYPHAISAFTTTALYTATFALSFAMPDPDHLDEGNSDYARNLSTHKLLRWLHLGGMVAQVVLGVLTANAQALFGLDRANNFAELQAMATVHEVIGLATFGLVTGAGAIMLF